MSFAHEVRDVALRLVGLLDREAIPYAFMGGIAVPIWGIPRATYDVDITLSADHAGVSRFLSACRSAGFEIDPPFETGFRDRLAGMEKLRIDWWTEQSRRVEVDVFLVTTDYQAAAFGRRVRVELEGVAVWVLTAADLVLHKLVAGRPKDLADIQNILAVQGVPDEHYLREWSERLQVAARLARSLDDAGLA